MWGLSNMKWTFAKGNGGRDTGFHDAGVETFQGNFDRYLARELIQNSLDAKADPTGGKAIEVRFEILTLDQSDVPDLVGLRKHLTACSQYWSHDPRAKKFFGEAAALAGEAKIQALRIGDFNTSGVTGKDDERDGMWYNLIRCAGASSKMGVEGGSFGIGKNAPFAASDLRTVLYSTYNTEAEHVFQGVAMLASHEMKGSVLQPIGYLGGTAGASVRKKAEIPDRFRRTKKGTDVIILGFPFSPNWDDDLVHSVLENFWPAIEFEDLVVKIGAQIVNKSTLNGLLQKFGKNEDFTAHLYYTAYTSGSHKFSLSLPRLKEVSLHIQTGDVNLPKRVAMVRKTGMVIFSKMFRSLTPFCGVLVCKSDEGNRRLRDMEPPRHDVWDPNYPTKGVNRKIEVEYTQFIRESLKQLAPADDSTIISVPGLNRFLPDDDDSPEENFGEDAKQDQADRATLPERIPGKKIEVRMKSSEPDNTAPGEGADITEGGEGEGSGGGPGEEENDAGGGSGGGGGGSGEGNAGPVAGQSGAGAHSKPSVPIQYRTFETATSEYAVNIRPEKGAAKRMVIGISAVGDDQRYVLKVASARLLSGQALPLTPEGYIGPVDSPDAGQPIRLIVRLSNSARVAMEVSAHEA